MDILMCMNCDNNFAFLYLFPLTIFYFFLIKVPSFNPTHWCGGLNRLFNQNIRICVIMLYQ